VQTIHRVFGTKPNLLKAVLDASIARDVEPVPVLQRSWVESLRAEPNATSAFRGPVDGAVTIVGRTTPIFEVVRRAASDPDAGALLDDTRRASSRRSTSGRTAGVHPALLALRAAQPRPISAG
jgi:hypothetical protein